MVKSFSHFEIYLVIIGSLLGPRTVFSQNITIRDLKPEIKILQPPSSQSMAITWEEYVNRKAPAQRQSPIDRSPAAVATYGSVREVVSQNELRKATLKNQLAHMERDLNQSFELMDDAPSGQRLEVHLTPTQSRASIRYIGFGENELSYNPITESVLMVAHLKLDGGSELVTEWMSGPLESSHKILWKWHF